MSTQRFGVRHPQEIHLARSYDIANKGVIPLAYPRELFLQRQPRVGKPHLSVHVGLWWSSNVGEAIDRMHASQAAKLMNYRQARRYVR